MRHWADSDPDVAVRGENRKRNGARAFARASGMTSTRPFASLRVDDNGALWPITSVPMCDRDEALWFVTELR
jgi:hypothetical protein